MSLRLPTTAGVAQDALVRLLADRDAFADVHVRRGLPPEPPSKRERVYVEAAEDLQRTRRADQGVREETYTLPVTVEVHLIARRDEQDRYATARDRAYELIDEVEVTVADDPEIDGTVHQALFESMPEMLVLPTDDGYIARGRALFRCTAWV